MTMTANQMIIRSAEAADTQVLARLGMQTFVDTFGHLYAKSDLEAFLAANHSLLVYRKLMHDPRYALWVATVERRLVGYSVAGPCGLPVPSPAALDGELKRLYVQKDFQNTGLGHRLFMPALSWLQANYKALYISVYEENHGARRLYERQEFVVHHRYEFMVGTHADPELIMRYER